MASANRAAGRSAEAGGLAVSRSDEAGGLALTRSGDLEEEEEGEEEEEEDNMTLGESRERSGQQENDSRGRETIEAGDSALEEDVSEEEVGWTKSKAKYFLLTSQWNKLLFNKFSVKLLKESITGTVLLNVVKKVILSGQIRIWIGLDPHHFL